MIFTDTHTHLYSEEFYEDLIKEVKLVYNPEEYRKFKTSKPLHTQNGVIKLLENDNNNSEINNFINKTKKNKYLCNLL